MHPVAERMHQEDASTDGEGSEREMEDGGMPGDRFGEAGVGDEVLAHAEDGELIGEQHRDRRVGDLAEDVLGDEPRQDDGADEAERARAEAGEDRPGRPADRLLLERRLLGHAPLSGSLMRVVFCPVRADTGGGVLGEPARRLDDPRTEATSHAAKLDEAPLAEAELPLVL